MELLLLFLFLALLVRIPPNQGRASNPQATKTRADTAFLKQCWTPGAMASI